MKQILIIFFIAVFCIACHQERTLYSVDKKELPNYFNLAFRKVNINGRFYASYSIEIKKTPKDKVSDFLKANRLRFDYLANKFFKQARLDSIYYDTNKVRQIFREWIGKDFFYNNFLSLISRDKDKKALNSFSEKEFMMVASRFFTCDSVRHSDTIIQSHICIGINGIEEMKSNRDLTPLEAFTIEGIFDCIYKKKYSFVKNFEESVRLFSKEEKKSFSSFSTFLSNVRERCYAVMENDPDLKSNLMNFYRKKRATINFQIAN